MHPAMQERDEQIPALVYEARPSRCDLVPPRERHHASLVRRGSAEALVGGAGGAVPATPEGERRLGQAGKQPPNQR